MSVAAIHRLLHLLRENCHLASFVLLMSLVVSWDCCFLHPDLLIDLSGVWEASACAPTQDDCDPWRQVNVPGHFLSDTARIKPWQRIRYRRSFTTPEPCRHQSCKLIFAEVGDTLDATFNGVSLRKLDPQNKKGTYEKNFALGVDLPPDILAPAGQLNRLTLSVRSLQKDQAGLRTAPVGVVEQTVGQRFVHGKTFRSLYLPLVGAVLVCFTALLLKLTSLAHLSGILWQAFDRYCLASALFMISFSELPRHILPLNIAISLHFLFRFAADGCLLELLIRMQPRAWPLKYARLLYVFALTVFSVLVCAGMASSVSLLDADIASDTYDVVRVLNPICSLAFIILSVHYLTRRQWLDALLGFSVWLLIFHDYLVGSGYLQAEFASKYYHAFIVLGYAFYLARQAGRRQEIERMKMAAQAQVADVARQVAHDVQSPLAALQTVTQIQTNLPLDLRCLVADAVERIRTTVEAMHMKTGTSFIKLERRPHELVPILTASMMEAKLKHRASNFIWQEDFSYAAGHFVSVDINIFRRVLSNLLNNAVEALREGENGHVRITARPTLTGQLRVTIADNGVGIPDAVLAKLGQRGLSVGKVGGSGLGLSHAWQTILAWEGRLVCRRLDQGGTRITIELPRVCEDVDAPEAQTVLKTWRRLRH